MNSDAWGRLSEWHNAWLDASPAERERLQRAFVAEHPALEADVTELVSAGSITPGFLETPAFALALHDLADEEAPLATGTQVGPYRIVELLAQGGMGQVYRATDVRLSRDVAVKVLAGAGRHDRDLVERFLQEARITAALDRPNIVRLFDVGIHDERPFLVMELLDGETLRERLARGALPPDATRSIALDVARGLVAAHAAGLIHRDLKPENLFLTRAGATKILDFGVAKLLPVSPLAQHDPATVAGMLVGTAGYLAPEQILGEGVDARADLFALGAILYEMLTGRRAFGREHTIDTLHAVLREPVESLSGAPSVPSDMAAIVDRLLAKTPDARFQSAADLAWALERLDASRTVDRSPVRSTRLRMRWRLVGAAAAVLAMILALVWLRPASSTPSGASSSGPALARFTWSLPEGMALGSQPLVSPNGRLIAFVGRTSAGSRVLVRDLSSLEAKTVPGTEGAKQPFWSPDSRSLAFFASGKLLRVTVEGGAPVPLADAPDGRGGAWGSKGTIVFQPAFRDSALMRVSADGGNVEPATLLDTEADDVSHRWPEFLPDGVHFLYYVVAESTPRRGVYIASTADSAARPGSQLFPSASGATYVARAGSAVGTLLTAGPENIEARPFDTRTRAVVGDAHTIAIPAAQASPHQAAMLGASADVLAVAATQIPWGSHLVAMSPTGERLQDLTGAELGGWAVLSPDGRRLLRTWVDPIRSNPDIWVRDLDRGTQLRVTTSSDLDVSPVWSPRGDRIAYRSGTVTKPHLAIANADGTGTAQTLPCPRLVCEPTDWSADGRSLLINEGRDVWIVPVDPQEPARPLLSSAFLERDARYSPDDRWIAYVSDESGRLEVSIRSLAGPPQRIVVSNQGGDQPVWKADGSALFYVDHQQLLQRVSVRASQNGGLTLGRPVRVQVPPFEHVHWGTSYDVSPDEARVYLPQRTEARAPREMTVILGWRALLQ
ncbi:MAG TPA: protein kinase [Vicinamibacterales bacterium]|nr:protein kinase [Vicinamibacterales bacterium]